MSNGHAAFKPGHFASFTETFVWLGVIHTIPQSHKQFWVFKTLEGCYSVSNGRAAFKLGHFASFTETVVWLGVHTTELSAQRGGEVERLSAFFEPHCSNNKAASFSSFRRNFSDEEQEEMVLFFAIDFRAFKRHLYLVTKPLSHRKTTSTERCTGVTPRACHRLLLWRISTLKRTKRNENLQILRLSFQRKHGLINKNY